MTFFLNFSLESNIICFHEFGRLNLAKKHKKIGFFNKKHILWILKDLLWRYYVHKKLT